MNMTRLFILIFILIFFTVSLIGTLRVKTYINAQKIIPYDSPLLTADTLFKNYHWKVKALKFFCEIFIVFIFICQTII